MKIEIRKSKIGNPVIILLCSIGLGIFLIWGGIAMVRQTHTRAVARAWGAALREVEKEPPGLARAEDLLARLKRIDLGYAPEELKRAIADYVAALDRSIQAAKEDEDTTTYDEALNQAKERMIAVAKKYN